ncbi:hypothetical protein ACOMHN_010563 [Nucella lapillus]
MYGKSNKESLRVDEAGQFLMDIRNEILTAMFEHDSAKKEELMAKAPESVTKKLSYLEGLAADNGKNGYFVAAKLTYADVMLFDSWDMIKGVVPAAETENDYPELKKILGIVKSVPFIKTYLARP